VHHVEEASLRLPNKSLERRPAAVSVWDAGAKTCQRMAG